MSRSRQGSIVMSGLAVAAVIGAVLAPAPASAADAQAERYLVSFRSDHDVAGQARALAARSGARVAASLAALGPYAVVEATPAQARALRSAAGVRRLVADLPFRGSDLPVVQDPAPWNLDVIDGTAFPRQQFRSDGVYTAYGDGAGTRVYVVDSGIDTTDADFGGRATLGPTFVPEEPNEDLEGHGTHVAGTVAGMTYGVAKAAGLVSVKVSDQDNATTLTRIMEGLAWIADDIVGRSEPTVVNMSLAGPRTAELDAAVAALSDAGTVVVAAAGNYIDDACLVSPGGAPEALTVAAYGKDGFLADFSARGSCVDMAAPGVDVPSDAPGPQVEAILSGTSMAAPHVAGLAAIYLGLNPGVPAEYVIDDLKSGGNGGVAAGISRAAHGVWTVPTVTASRETVTWPQTISYTASVTRVDGVAPDGAVRWWVDGERVTDYQLLTEGVPTSPVLALGAGTHEIRAAYDYWYTSPDMPSSKVVTLTVLKAPTGLVAGRTSKAAAPGGTAVTMRATLTYGQSTPFVGRSVLFTIASRTCTATTTSTGEAVCTVVLPKATVGRTSSFVATYFGDANTLLSSVTGSTK